MTPIKIQFKCYLIIVGLSIIQAATIVKAQQDPILANIPDSMVFDTFPVYQGPPHAVHPDVVYFPKGHNGHYFYMAVNPLSTSDYYENPSILVSENGYDYYEEVPGMNPLKGAPPYDHNDDPDLFWNEPTQEFLMYYLETMRPDSQNVNLLRSADGINWTLSTPIHYDLNAGDLFMVSPAMVKKDNIYYMFYVNLSVAPHRLQYITSTDGLTWDKSKTNEIAISFPGAVVPWHVNVFPGANGRFYMLSNAYPGTNAYYQHHLYLATSTDLAKWDLVQTPILKSNSFFGSLSNKMVYRSSGLVDTTQDALIVWVSMHGSDSWRMAVKKFYNLSSLVAAQIENEENINIVISPNPSHGAFTISIEGLQGAVDLSLTNLQGQLVCQEKLSVTNKCTRRFDISDYPKGIYFLKLTNDNFVKVEKITIQ